MAKNPLPKIGDEKGKLKVTEVIPAAWGSGQRSTLVCDCLLCGKPGFRVLVKDYNSGNTRSCGCAGRTQGGGSYDDEYRVWWSMIRRCTVTTAKGYSDYGGRGVRVCERWLTSYAAFLEDMGRKPSPKHSIERIRNGEGYEPGNCRWATKVEQANNTRRNRKLDHDGRCLTVAQWSRETGIAVKSIRWRLTHGWTVEKTLTTP